METVVQKADYLKHDYIPALRAINPDTPPAWGKMNVHQMIEHMSDMLRVAYGKHDFKIMTPDEHLPKMQEFVMSEKLFKENTVNRLMSDTPAPPKYEMEKSIEELQGELDNFFSYYKDNPDKKVINPFFGNLDYEMQVRLIYKHALHHLRQFGIAV